MPKSSFDEARKDLGAFLGAIEAYLGQVVLCGGWVPFFYRRLPGIAPIPLNPLLTYDYDVTVPRNLSPDSSGSLHDAIIGGRFLALRRNDPPVVIYQHERWGGEVRAPIYAELLTPLHGSDTDRAGRTKILLEVQKGLFAQQLRYLDLLLFQPLSLDLVRIPELKIKGSMILRIPNPAAYLLQKALIRGKRRPASRLKDIAYMFEVGLLWSKQAHTIRAQMLAIAGQSREWRAWVEKGENTMRELFEDPSSDGPVSIERVYRDRNEGSFVDSEMAYRVMSEFIENILTA